MLLPTSDVENVVRKNGNVHIVDFVKTVRIRLVACNNIKLILLSSRLSVLHVKKKELEKDSKCNQCGSRCMMCAKMKKRKVC